jgi:hypothetical protein
MRRSMLLFLVALAGCSKGPQADLQYISKARSLAAEWAMVNQQASENKLTRAYVQSMRQSLREQVRTASQALTVPDSTYAKEIDALTAEPEDASPDALSAHADKLKQIEDDLESA